MIAPGSLVRYRCLVQDTFNPEYFLDFYQARIAPDAPDLSVFTGRFRDQLIPAPENMAMNAPGSVVSERLPLYCVPVPGEATWARASYASQGMAAHEVEDHVSAGAPARSKRRHAREDKEEGGDHGHQEAAGYATGAGSLAAASEMGEGEGGGASAAASAATEAETIMAAAISSAAKKRRSSGSSASMGSSIGSNPMQQLKEHSSGSAASDLDLNLPLGAAEAPPVIVKMYDMDHGVKIMDMVEFVGVYTPDIGADASVRAVAEAEAAGGVSGIGPTAAEIRAHCPPSSLVPRLHCITHAVRAHNNPALPSVVSPDAIAAAAATAAVVRPALIKAFTGLLGGDTLAAEFTLAHLISRVHTRMSDGLVLGKLALNLYGINGGAGAAMIAGLCAAIGDLVPASHSFSMTLANMNGVRMTPVKDNEADRVAAGALQLGAGTQLVLDETCLGEGRLEDQVLMETK
eukprot:UC1_evm1s1948